ncbi:MAG: hypothetical protein KatS3mg077_1939 [Candidatus Binatia bacterium]|nr:MAG: hypothetical protein KatS3mg077_1939 [Candidatus Binatia bacterium]
MRKPETPPWDALLPRPSSHRVRARVQALPLEFQHWLVSRASGYERSAPRLVEQLCRAAATIYEHAGAVGFSAWQFALDSLQSYSPATRSAIEAFLAASERKPDPETLSAWVTAALSLREVSSHLVAEFLAATVDFVGRVPRERLVQAAQVAAQTVPTDRWRAEFVARAFVAALASCMNDLDAEALSLWYSLGTRLHRPERGRSFFASLPKSLLRWDEEEQNLFLRALLEISGQEEAAWALYCQIPEAVRRMSPSLRRCVLRAFALGAPVSVRRWVELAPVLGAVFAPLSPSQRHTAARAAEQVSCSLPGAVADLLRSLPRIFELAPEERVTRWVECGLELCAGEVALGQAYFSLDTRTSRDVLGASPTAAVFHEGQRWLRQLTQMLSAVPVVLRPQPGWTLRPPLEGIFEEHIAELPDRIDFFPAHEDNLGLYRFLVMQVAGRFLCGTAPQAPDVWPQWKHELDERAARHPQLADWFLLCEGIRVGAQMAQRFRGWAVEQQRLLQQFCLRALAIEEPKRPNAYDWLLAWELARAPLGDLPEPLRTAGAIVRGVVAPLHRPEATVADTWARAQQLERLFAHMSQATFSKTITASEDVPAYLLPVDLYEGDAPVAESQSAVSTASEPLDFEEQLAAKIAGKDERPTSGPPLSAETLKALLEAGATLELKQGHFAPVEGLGLYISDLPGKLPQEQLQELRSLLDEGTGAGKVRKWLAAETAGEAFYYDEWDYLLNDYRAAWCRLIELPLEGDGGEFFSRTISDYAALLPLVRREFQKIRPDSYRVVRGLEAGEDFDLNAVVDARSDQRARRAPSTKLYVARQREERDVAVLFLVDMSASTDEPVDHPAGKNGADRTRAGSQRRIIDITKEALVIMAEALEELGDSYAIYGFSGHGRQRVEFYVVKSFREGLSVAVRGRIGALEPKRSTRMGAALRHAVTKMAEVPARSRHIILLSDGFPQDFDYGQDRRSNTYGLRDTTAALQECEARGIVPFCITVDRAGHDYLREMCPQSRYLVIDDITALPRELPKIYQRVVTA